MENQENIAIRCLVEKLLTYHKDLNKIIKTTETEHDMDEFEDIIYDLVGDLYDDYGVFKEVLNNNGISEGVADKIYKSWGTITSIVNVLTDVFKMDRDIVHDALSYAVDVKKGVEDLIRDSNEAKGE